jgi:hypothetical protein
MMPAHVLGIDQVYGIYISSIHRIGHHLDRLNKIYSKIHIQVNICLMLFNFAVEYAKRKVQKMRRD